MNNLWFISDTHFFHTNVINYSKRPFNNIKEMNEYFLHNWNLSVKENDIVYHLGDFALGNTHTLGEEYILLHKLISNLNGEIHLVPGNHDTDAKLELYKKYFIVEQPLIKLKKENVVLCHYPLAKWYHDYRGTLQFHGHCHGNFPAKINQIDVGVDCDPYKYSVKHFDELKLEIKKRDENK